MSGLCLDCQDTVQTLAFRVPVYHMPPKLPNKKTKSEYHQATLARPPPICENVYCRLEGDFPHTHADMLEHLACKKREQRKLSVLKKSQKPELKFSDENPDLEQVKEAL